MSTPPEPPETDDPLDTLKYVLANLDEARGHLERANAALATATVVGRLVIVNGGKSNDEE